MRKNEARNLWIATAGSKCYMEKKPTMPAAPGEYSTAISDRVLGLVKNKNKTQN